MMNFMIFDIWSADPGLNRFSSPRDLTRLECFNRAETLWKRLSDRLRPDFELNSKSFVGFSAGVENPPQNSYLSRSGVQRLFARGSNTYRGISSPLQVTCSDKKPSIWAGQNIRIRPVFRIFLKYFSIKWYYFWKSSLQNFIADRMVTVRRLDKVYRES